jgi:hypothetical protein
MGQFATLLRHVRPVRRQLIAGCDTTSFAEKRMI